MKKTKHLNRPAANKNEVSWSGQTSGPKSVALPRTEIVGLRYADWLAELTKVSSTVQRSKATEQIFVKKPLLVPALSANHRSQKAKILNRNCAALKQRRRKRRLHDEVATRRGVKGNEVGSIIMQPLKAVPSLILAHMQYNIESSHVLRGLCLGGSYTEQGRGLVL